MTSEREISRLRKLIGCAVVGVRNADPDAALAALETAAKILEPAHGRCCERAVNVVLVPGVDRLDVIGLARSERS